MDSQTSGGASNFRNFLYDYINCLTSFETNVTWSTLRLPPVFPPAESVEPMPERSYFDNGFFHYVKQDLSNTYWPANYEELSDWPDDIEGDSDEEEDERKNENKEEKIGEGEEDEKEEDEEDEKEEDEEDEKEEDEEDEKEEDEEDEEEDEDEEEEWVKIIYISKPSAPKVSYTCSLLTTPLKPEVMIRSRKKASTICSKMVRPEPDNPGCPDHSWEQAMTRLSEKAPETHLQDD